MQQERNLKSLLTSKQQRFFQLLKSNDSVAAYGGARSGKTFAACAALATIAAQVPDIRLFIARRSYNHAVATIGIDTMPKVLRLLGWKEVVYDRKVPVLYSFPNGSRIELIGLENKERTEKVLGGEVAALFFNECSSLSFDSFEMVLTRLNPPSGMRPKIIIDYNPPSQSHWLYNYIENGKRPDGSALKRPISKIKINPQDNAENINESYMESLAQLSGLMRERFLYGNYTAIKGDVYDVDRINFYENVPESLDMIVITADTAFKTGAHCDFTCIQIWGVAGRRKKWAGAWLLDLLWGKWEAPELILNIKKSIALGGHYGEVERVLIEDKASGIGLIQTLKREEALPIKGFPIEESKVNRAMTSSVAVSAGKIWLPKTHRYTSAIISELAGFSADCSHQHDDFCDALAILIYYLEGIRK